MELMLVGNEISAKRMYQVGLETGCYPQGSNSLPPWNTRALADNAPLVLSVLRDYVGRIIPKGPSEPAAQGRATIPRIRQSADARSYASFNDKRMHCFLEKK